MQVGDDEQALLFPEQRAGEIGDQRDAGDDKCRAGDIDGGAHGGRFVVLELCACRHV